MVVREPLLEFANRLFKACAVGLTRRIAAYFNGIAIEFQRSLDPRACGVQTIALNEKADPISFYRLLYAAQCRKVPLGASGSSTTRA